jgi:hypothetical protein
MTFTCQPSGRRIGLHPFRTAPLARQASGIGSGINKMLIINREIQPERIPVILVNEVLGF